MQFQRRNIGVDGRLTYREQRPNFIEQPVSDPYKHSIVGLVHKCRAPSRVPFSQESRLFCWRRQASAINWDSVCLVREDAIFPLGEGLNVLLNIQLYAPAGVVD